MSETAAGLFPPRSAVIETPEGVIFALPFAGPVTRFLAWLIDTLLIISLCSAIGRIAQLFASLSTDSTVAFGLLAYFAIWIGYGIVFEWRWHGQTPGKRVLSLRVMDAAGLKLQFSQIAIRNLMRSLDSLPGLYLVGGAAMLLTSRYQRLGDLVSNTVVVRKRQLPLPDLAALAERERFNSLLDAPHLSARLRAQVSPELAQLAYQALLRRDSLTPETRILIFRAIAARFKQVVKFPDEITLALGDERYVRNALEVITLKSVSPRFSSRPNSTPTNPATDIASASNP